MRLWPPCNAVNLVMIDAVLVVLKDAVNAHLSASSGWGDSLADQGQVAFMESERVDAADFKLGAVTLMLVNLEQEHSMRLAEPYRVSMPDGSSQRVSPPIFLNIYVLFVSRFKDYQQSLRYVSFILQFFQNHRVLNRENTPALDERIEKIIMELITLPMAEQHNLWGLLRTTYHPSLLYRAKMVVYQDEDGVTVPAGSAPVLRINQ
jgi:hypothetical protein